MDVQYECRAEKARMKSKTINHRTRVGLERSNRTRARILDAAMRIFAEKGPDAPVINDFITAAGMSRGTFYNHFNSVDELLLATSKQLEDDLILSIEGEINAIESPSERVTLGMTLWLEKSRNDPVWCAFVNRVAHHSTMVESQLGSDLRDGIACGEFNCTDINAGYDLVVGSLRQAMSRFLSENPSPDYQKQIICSVLQGLGVTPKRITQLLNRSVPRMRRPSMTVSAGNTAD
jgi:AcrR family transcriptional regulator